MNLWDSLPNHENRKVFDGTPLQGQPFKAAAIIVKGGVGKKGCIIPK